MSKRLGINSPILSFLYFSSMLTRNSAATKVGAFFLPGYPVGGQAQSAQKYHEPGQVDPHSLSMKPSRGCVCLGGGGG